MNFTFPPLIMGILIGAALSIFLKGVWEPIAALAGKTLYREARETAVSQALESLDALLIPQILGFLDQAILSTAPATVTQKETIARAVSKEFNLGVLVDKAMGETIGG